MTDDALTAEGYRKSVKVYITKPGQPPVIIPRCWARIRGERVDVICDKPFDLVQTPVTALTASLDRCLIGWESEPCP